MKLIQYDPYFNTALNEFDRLFSEMFDRRGQTSSQSFGNSFRVNFQEDTDNRYLVAELPGFSKKDLSLEVDRAVLTIKASRTEGENENAHKLEFQRDIPIGEDVNPEKIEAKLENGLLQVILPKLEQRKARQITVA